MRTILYYTREKFFVDLKTLLMCVAMSGVCVCVCVLFLCERRELEVVRAYEQRDNHSFQLVFALSGMLAFFINMSQIWCTKVIVMLKQPQRKLSAEKTIGAQNYRQGKLSAERTIALQNESHGGSITQTSSGQKPSQPDERLYQKALLRFFAPVVL
eukprot:COSAG06_NODE_541_length_14471_cov_35.139229_11_plen_156_part_00